MVLDRSGEARTLQGGVLGIMKCRKCGYDEEYHWDDNGRLRCPYTMTEFEGRAVGVFMPQGDWYEV